MKKIDNQKLIDHIEGAKDWLDKAKAEYDSANPTGGELILNLAGAEIKYAWELSRSRYVFTQKKAASGRILKMALPIAASIILLLGLGFWLQTAHLITPKRFSALNNSSKPISNEISTKGNQGSTGNIGTIVAVTKPSEQLKSANQIIPGKSESQTVKDSSETERIVSHNQNTVVSNQNRVADQPSAQPNLQPVTQLSIDEEALTKEASHSLRNGK